MSIHVLLMSKKQTQFWMMTEKCLTINLFCLNTGNYQYTSVADKKLYFTISERTTKYSGSSHNLVSGHLYLWPPSQNPFFLNSHTNKVSIFPFP